MSSTSSARPQGKRTSPGKAEPAAQATGKDMPLKRGTTGVDMRIYRAVVNAVMSHRLPPGTHLGEADFCELYQVSRTTAVSYTHLTLPTNREV